MQGKFRVILPNGFDIITTMIVKNTFSKLTSFEVKVLIAERFRLEQQKKNLLNLLAGNRAEQIQSYHLN